MGTFFGLEGEQVLAVPGDASRSHFIGRMAYDDVGEGAFAGSVKPHEGMYLTVLHGQVNAFQYFFATYAGM